MRASRSCECGRVAHRGGSGSYETCRARCRARARRTRNLSARHARRLHLEIHPLRSSTLTNSRRSSHGRNSPNGAQRQNPTPESAAAAASSRNHRAKLFPVRQRADLFCREPPAHRRRRCRCSFRQPARVSAPPHALPHLTHRLRQSPLELEISATNRCRQVLKFGEAPLAHRRLANRVCVCSARDLGGSFSHRSSASAKRRNGQRPNDSAFNVAPC